MGVGAVAGGAPGLSGLLLACRAGGASFFGFNPPRSSPPFLSASSPPPHPPSVIPPPLFLVAPPPRLSSPRLCLHPARSRSRAAEAPPSSAGQTAVARDRSHSCP